MTDTMDTLTPGITRHSVKCDHDVALRSVSGNRSNEVWAVGDGGTILRWNGTVWSQLPSGTTAQLRGVFGVDVTQPDKPLYHNATFVGEMGTILSWNGTTLTRELSGSVQTLNGVWGLHGVVLTVGAMGTILRQDSPFVWTSAGTMGITADLNAIWQRSPPQAWIVGNQGIILQKSVSTWAALPSPTTRNLLGLWVAGQTTVPDGWAVGMEGTALHLQGSNWTVANSKSTEHLTGVWGSSAQDVWVTGHGGTVLRYDGSRWRKVHTGTTVDLFSVWGSGAQDIWVVGADCTILHYGSP